LFDSLHPPFQTVVSETAIVQKKKTKKKHKMKDKEKPKAIQQIDGTGIEIIYDSSKGVFILSDRAEDQLILSLSLNKQETNRIHKSTMSVLAYNYSISSQTKQRIWRRFIRIYIGDALFCIIFTPINIMISTNRFHITFVIIC
jgi:hypothetical protein